MKKRTKGILLAVLFCALTLPALAASSLSSSELERLLAPIALFPDSLLGNILQASTFPDDVIDADAWIAEHSSLTPDQVMKECEKQKWDASVKALLLVPETLAQMCNDMDWTEKLANAFVDQNEAVMDAIQRLRKRAKNNGSLKDSKDVKVVSDDKGNVSIGTTKTDVIVVPQYSPTVVYAEPGSSVSTAAAITWGCIFVADIVYNCCVWDWIDHHCWFGPGYNSCYFYGGVFHPWGPACVVPPPLVRPVPPPPCHPHHPPYDPHRNPYHDPHHPPHHDPHNGPHHDIHDGPHHDSHDGPHHGPNDGPRSGQPNRHDRYPSATRGSLDSHSLTKPTDTDAEPHRGYDKTQRSHQADRSGDRLDIRPSGDDRHSRSRQSLSRDISGGSRQNLNTRGLDTSNSARSNISRLSDNRSSLDNLSSRHSRQSSGGSRQHSGYSSRQSGSDQVFSSSRDISSTQRSFSSSGRSSRHSGGGHLTRGRRR